MPDFFCIHDYILHFGPTQWIRIINKSLEVYKNEVEKDTFEQNLQKMDIFCDKCFKNNPVSQKSSPSLPWNKYDASFWTLIIGNWKLI